MGGFGLERGYSFIFWANAVAVQKLALVLSGQRAILRRCQQVRARPVEDIVDRVGPNQCSNVGVLKPVMERIHKVTRG